MMQCAAAGVNEPVEAPPRPVSELVPRDMFDRIIATGDFIICPSSEHVLLIAKVRAVEARQSGRTTYFVLTASVCESKPLGGLPYDPLYTELYGPQKYIRVPRVVIPTQVLKLLDKPVDRKGTH